MLSYTFPIKYHCDACGDHFNGGLYVQVGEEVAFERERCLYCGSERTSPHVLAADNVWTTEHLTPTHYLSALSKSLHEYPSRERERAYDVILRSLREQRVVRVDVVERHPAKPKQEPEDQRLGWMGAR